MKTKIKLLLLFLAISFYSFAQKFDPVETEKSLVRIEIKQGNKVFASSGFIWKDASTVVTSLHAMKKGATYKVYYDNKHPRDAKIEKVYKDADLVLLKTNLDEKPLSVDVKPIKIFNRDRPAFEDKLYAQGYHGGSKGRRTTPLEKNRLDPEKLKFLVTDPDKQQTLIDLGFPSLNLDILYLVGNLLPGFSGSPIYNKKGELVAIGNGGLENGATGVSWAIPAIYLDELDKSSISELPSNLKQIDLLMSSQVAVEIDPNDMSEEAIQQKLDEQYAVYEGGEYEFVKTKNRSFNEMYKSSYDTENLDFFKSNLDRSNITVDYEYIRFDLYDDVKNGVTIAVPEGSELVYHPESESFSVDLSNYALNEYFSLEYFGFTDYDLEDVDMAADELLDAIDMTMAGDYGTFNENEKSSFSFELGKDSEIVYILYESEDTKYEEWDDDEHRLRYYFTVLRNGNQFFYSKCTISLPTIKMEDAMNDGVDCENNYEGYPEACEFFEQYIRVQAAAQFTTISGSLIAKD